MKSHLEVLENLYHGIKNKRKNVFTAKQHKAI